MVAQSMTNETRIYSGGKTVSSISSAKETRQFQIKE